MQGLVCLRYRDQVVSSRLCSLSQTIIFLKFKTTNIFAIIVNLFFTSALCRSLSSSDLRPRPRHLHHRRQHHDHQQQRRPSYLTQHDSDRHNVVSIFNIITTGNTPRPTSTELYQQQQQHEHILEPYETLLTIISIIDIIIASTIVNTLRIKTGLRVEALHKSHSLSSHHSSLVVASAAHSVGP